MLLWSIIFFCHCDFMCVGLWKDKPDQQQLKMGQRSVAIKTSTIPQTKNKQLLQVNVLHPIGLKRDVWHTKLF